MRTLLQETVIQRPAGEVFSFFSRAENLNLLTPEGLSFKILTPLPIKMEKGTIIDYSIRLGGISFKWKTEITEWNPPHKFTDVQLKGPYSVWIHEHFFTDAGGATIVKDKVTYKAKGWLLEPVIHRVFVSKKLANIFDYRQKKLNLIFKNDD